MKFTLKGIEPEKQESVYQGIVKFAQQASPTPILDNRVWSIDCDFDERRTTLRVADSSVLGEQVVCIFETADSSPFLICTINRGVVRGMPVVLGKREVHGVIYFDE